MNAVTITKSCPRDIRDFEDGRQVDQVLLVRDAETGKTRAAQGAADVLRIEVMDNQGTHGSLALTRAVRHLHARLGCDLGHLRQSTALEHLPNCRLGWWFRAVQIATRNSFLLPTTV